MAFGVYGIFFPGKWVYVGSTIASLNTRHRVHLKALSDHKHDNDKMQELYDKYGVAEFRTLEESTNKNEVRELEQYYIEEMQRQGYKLCNETPALIEGNPLGEIVKQKISEGRRKGKGGRKKIKDIIAESEASPEPPKGLSEYHKKLYEMRKQQGW